MNRRLRVFLRYIQEGSWYVMLFLLPFSKAAVEIGFGFLLIPWLLERLIPATRAETVWRAPQLRWLGIAIGVFLLICMASPLWSRYPLLSLSGFVNKWLEYLLFVIIVADIGVRPGRLSRSVAVLAVSSVFVLVESAVQVRSGRGLFMHRRFDYFGHITGPYENPIDLAIYLAVVITPVCMYALSQKRWRRLGALMGLVLLVVGVAKTMAVGVYVAFLCASLGLLIAYRPVRRYALLIVLVLLVMGGLALESSGKLSSVLSSLQVGKVDRLVMWQAAWRMIQERPLVGHGVNTFMANYLHYWVGGEKQPRYAHNCYLQMWAEVGLIGCAAFLWVLIESFRVWIRGWKYTGSKTELFLRVGVVGSLLTFVLHAAIDTDFYSLRQAALFWVLAGLITGASRRAQQGELHARADRA